MPWICGVLMLLADQWSKRTMQARPVLDCGALLRFRFVAHRERFYDSTAARAAMILLWMLALACAVVLSRYTPWFQSEVSQIGLGLLFGGAAGNLLDIFRHGFVIDFIDLGWWPVFNVADAAIVAGLTISVLF